MAHLYILWYNDVYISLSLLICSIASRRGGRCSGRDRQAASGVNALDIAMFGNIVYRLKRVTHLDRSYFKKCI